MPQINFEVKIRERLISASVEVPAEPVSAVDLLPIIQAFDNAVVSAASEGFPVTCTKGCAACCRQVIAISETEAKHLLQLIDSLPPEPKARILARFKEAVEKIKAAGLLDRLKPESLPDPEKRGAAAKEYFHLWIDCPFLDGELCSIHDDRPLTCREYLVLSPPKYCFKPEEGKGQMLIVPRALSNVLYRFGDGEGKAPARMIPLTLLFECELPEQPRLPGPQLFENFFRAATAPTD
jgi:Fe-S-cluster containining protein